MNVQTIIFIFNVDRDQTLRCIEKPQRAPGVKINIQRVITVSLACKTHLRASERILYTKWMCVYFHATDARCVRAPATTMHAPLERDDDDASEVWLLFFSAASRTGVPEMSESSLRFNLS